ncbi:MAG: hypothetical protein NUV90_01120 [Candidatus Parcubacteria bacterium]|nr:hypothetical protein [Candidatus Parcubacteria bacterium]
MKSRWANQKPAAIILRRKGNSIGSIETMLGIPRSTLSGWFRSVPLTKRQQQNLKKRWEQGLVKARVKAVHWHNAQKNARLEKAAQMGAETLKHLSNDAAILELALAFLYLGEGSKTHDGTSLGSSDPRIAKFFVRSLSKIYNVSTENIRCYLHLRADQNVEKMKRYWSHELRLPLSNFGKASIDKRTEGRPTYPHYKGVCLIECGRVDIRRRLMYIANGFCDKIVQNPEISSGG